MQMMDQDTSLAALEVASHVLYDNTVLAVANDLSDRHLVPVSYGTEGKDAESLLGQGKSQVRGQGTVSLTLPRPMKKPKGNVKSWHAPSTIGRKVEKKGVPIVISPDGVQAATSDIFTDQVHSQSAIGAKMYLTDTRKSAKHHHKETITTELTTAVHITARPTRKVTKSSLRRLKRNLGKKSTGLEERMPVEMSPTEEAGNKAENNNWMLDTDEPVKAQGGCVVPTLHTKSSAPGFNSFIQPKSDCNATSKTPPVGNTCDVSSLPRESSNLQGDCNLEKCSPNGKTVIKPVGSPDSKRISRNAGVCVSCGNGIHTPKYALCKHCGVRNRPDENRNGPLDELKTYAQNFANSVKKILLSSPVLEINEIVQSLTPERTEGGSTKAPTQEETMPRRSGPELSLNRYMTEINMGSRSEARSKSLLSKSMSYDGRVGSNMDEKDLRSPMHWISHSRDKASDSFPKMSESRLKHVDADDFITGKEEKQLLAYEADKYRVNKAEKFKAKGANKQMARVERARTDGDLRTNTAQPTILNKKQVKDDSKKGYEFQRNRSKTFHELDAGSDEQGSCSPQREAEADIKISRLKVIHEGSPVDPPKAAECKKCDDGKGRKTVFIRSATAPYKNHQSRKETATSLAGLDGAERISRTNTKIMVRTNKASTLRKENSLSDRRRVQDILEAYDDDGSVINSMPYIKGRSTSYDGSQVGPKRDELHRSSSWSVIDGNEEEVKHRKESSPAGNVNRRNQQTGLSANSGPPSRFRVSVKEKYQSTDDIAVDPFLYSELPADAFKQRRREAGSTELAIASSQERSCCGNEEQLQLMQSQNEHAFEVEQMYYDDGSEKRLSPCIEEEEEDQKIIEDQNEDHFKNESYYTESPHATKQAEAVDNVSQDDRYNDKSDFKTVGEHEAIYHDDINKYVSSDITEDKNSAWYSPQQVLSSDERSLVRRDRSLESKSTTSFHIVTMAKSSHSDEAISKYSSVFDHALSRRQSMYTETDVDTGLIYHLATRQTTRAHVPPYHDLTTGSREIYTMSGDVSTSTSSNSANSNRSDLSECAYTGGFFKDDPFYDNDSQGSRSSSSQESASNIYFESTGVSKRELSELDIYTGSIFNSNQKTMASSHVGGTENSIQEIYVKDGRIIASARSGIGKMQRSVRCRPRVDVMTFRSNDSAWEYFSQPLVICGEARCCNVSNNSSNWYDVDEFDSSGQNCSLITKSADPLYTDYDPGTRPEFNVKHIEKSGSTMFDFLKYDDAGEPSKPFTPPRREDSGSDSMWYSGLLSEQNINEVEIPTSSSNHSLDRSPYSWQYYDDYYKSTVRPIVKNTTNNCSSCHESSSILGDANNNHFDDIYTGSYGAQNTPPPPQQQAQPVRPPATENWYVKQPTPAYTSSTVYDQGYESCYTVPGPARKSASEVYEPVRDPYSTYASPNKVFGHEPPTTTESSVYMMDDGWWKYGPKISSPMDEQQPRRPEKPPNREPESYFNYVSKVSPERSFYVIDDDTYSFEPKVEVETPETPAVKEIKTVGGIVCRENVANKDDYAEDINRDLEPGAWVPFTFRRDDDTKYPQETVGSHDKQEAQRSSEVSGTGPNSKFSDDMYANNRLYDNVGARKNWQRTQAKPDSNASRSRDSSRHRSFQSGDTGKQDQAKNRNSADTIPDKARGKRNVSNASKTAATENCSGTNKASGSSSSYEAQNTALPPQQPAHPVRSPGRENWNAKQPTPGYTSCTVNYKNFESCYTVPDTARKSTSDVYEPVRDMMDATTWDEPCTITNKVNKKIIRRIISPDGVQAATSIEFRDQVHSQSAIGAKIVDTQNHVKHDNKVAVAIVTLGLNTNHKQNVYYLELYNFVNVFDNILCVLKEDVKNWHASSTVGREVEKKGVPIVIRPGGVQVATSDIFTDQVHSQSAIGAKMYLTDRKKHAKHHHKEAITTELTTAAHSTARPTRKDTNSSLRRLKQNLGLKSAGLEERMPVEISPTEEAGNKAENNNWMLDTDEPVNTQGGCVVPTLHTNSSAPGFNSFIQPKSDCNMESKTPPVGNTCDVSSLPRESSNLQRDCNMEKCSPNGKMVIKPAGSPDSKRIPRNAGVCVSCGNDIHTPKYALCKHCGVRNRPDENHNGPLDELKTYAQNFANSVKKILLSSPVLEISEIVQSLTPERTEGESAPTLFTDCAAENTNNSSDSKNDPPKEDTPRDEKPTIQNIYYVSQCPMVFQGGCNMGLSTQSGCSTSGCSRDGCSHAGTHGGSTHMSWTNAGCSKDFNNPPGTSPPCKTPKKPNDQGTKSAPADITEMPTSILPAKPCSSMPSSVPCSSKHPCKKKQLAGLRKKKKKKLCPK